MSSEPKRGRGRPQRFPEAASLDEAIMLREAGMLPKRGRNEWERRALRDRAGRKPQPQAVTRQAAELAAYLVQWDGRSLRAASAEAAERFGLKSADTVRRYARRVIYGPQVTGQAVARVTWLGTVPGATTSVPFLHSIEDVA